MLKTSRSTLAGWLLYSKNTSRIRQKIPDGKQDPKTILNINDQFMLTRSVCWNAAASLNNSTVVMGSDRLTTTTVIIRMPG